MCESVCVHICVYVYVCVLCMSVYVCVFVGGCVLCVKCICVYAGAMGLKPLPAKCMKIVSQFSRSVVSDCLQPHGLQHARPPCHHQLPEFTQTHVHLVSDAIQPSHPLLSPSGLFGV